MKNKSTIRSGYRQSGLAALVSLFIGSMLMPNQVFAAAGPEANDDPNFLTVTEDDGLTTVAASGVLDNDLPKGGDLDQVNATPVVGTTITLTSGATLQQNADGSVEYNPNGAFEFLDDSESTTDTYTYRINKAGLRDSATVTITITGVNDAPVGVDDSGAGFSTDEDTSFTTASALTNDTDIDVETLTLFDVDALSAKGATVTILDANAGTFTYDPTGSATLQALTAAGNTTDTFTYTVSDGTATDTATITIAVSGVNDGPTGVMDSGAGFITNEDSSFTTGNVLSNDIEPDTDPVADSLAVTLADATSFMGASVTILDANGGTFTYDPTGSATLQGLDDAENTFDSFSYTLSDGVLTSTATVLISVAGVNDAPVAADDSGAGFSTDEDTSFATGSALTNDTDIDVETLTLSGVDALSAKGASVTILDANAGTFTYDPTGSATLQAMLAAGNTTDTFSYTVSDGTDTDTATITIAVSGLNDAPTGVNDSGAGFATDEDSSFTTGNVLTNDIEIDAESLTVTLVDASSAMGASVTILSASGGTFTYDPTGSATLQALDVTEDVLDTFSYTLSDGTTTSTATVTIAVTALNDAPVGVDDGGAGFATDEDTSFTTVSVLTNDTDVDVEALTVSSADAISAKGASVTILDANAGTFTYDPTGSTTLQALLAAGNTTDTFSYTVSDGTDTDTATVTISVSGLNDAPTGVDDSGAGFATDEDSSFATGNVLSNDLEIDAESLTVTLVDATSAKGASVTILSASGGTFTYDPTGSATLQALDTGEDTTDTFSYTLSDGTTTSTATVTIAITALNDAPVGVDDSGAGFSTTEDASFTTGSALTNDTDTDVETLTLAGVDALSSKGASVTILDANAGTFTYDPTGSATLQALTAAGNTTDTFNYTVSDGTDTDTATITISVSGLNDAPTGIDDSGAGFSTDEDSSFTTGNVLTNDIEIDAESLTVTLVDATSAMGASVTILSASGGTFTYDPTGSATLQALDVTEDVLDTFSYTLSDGTTTSTATVTIAVTALNDAPVGVDDSGAGFATDEDASFTTGNVLTNDTDIDVETLILAGVDATSAKGASVTILDANAGTFTYDASGSATLQALDDAENTTDTFSYTLSDGTTTSTATVTISVAGLNDAPVAVDDSGAGFSTTEDASFTTASALTNDTDIDVETLTLAGVDATSAKGASVSILDANAGTFTYDPTGSATLQTLTVAANTTDTFSYTVSDGTTTDTATITISVSGVNDAPTGVNDSGVGFSTDEDSSFTTGNVLTNDLETDAEALTVTLVDATSAMGASVTILSASGGTFTYDPTGSATLQALDVTEDVLDTFSYTLSDGTTTSTATVTIAVTALNDAPVGVDDSGAGFATDEDTSFTTVSVLINDTDVDVETLVVTSADATSAKGASVTIIDVNAGTFTYDPTGSPTLQALVAAGNTTDTFSYTVSDGTDTDTATVTISVSGLNDDPTGVNDSGAGFATDEDSSFTTGNVLTNDIEIDAEPLTVTLVDASSAMGASVTILSASGGTFTYDPTGSATLQALDVTEDTTDTFNYTLSDGTTTSTATVTIAVTALNDAPVGVDDSGAGFATDEDTSFTTVSVLINDTDVDVEALVVASADATSAKGASVTIIDANAGTFTYDPTGSATLQALLAAGNTTDTFSYTVSDGTDTDTATVTISVSGLNDAPTGVNDSGVGFSTDEDSSFTTGNVLTNDIEPDAESLTVTLVDVISAKGASVTILSASGGTFTYDPTGSATLQALDDAENMTDTFTYTLSDGTITSTATVTVSIAGLNDAPVGVSDSGAGFATDEDASFTTGNVLANDTDIDVETLTLTAVDATSAKGASVTILDANAGTFTYDASGSATLQALDDAENTTDSFSYTLSDGTTTSMATVTISVAGLNDAPVGVDDGPTGLGLFKTNEDKEWITGSVLINDTDVDVETLTLTGVDALSAKGASVSIDDANLGTFKYDPRGSATLQTLIDGGQTTDTFSYTVSDGTDTGTATVTMKVNGRNDDPTGVDDSGVGFSTDEDSSFATGNVLSNDLEIDDEALFVTLVDATSSKGASVTILDANAGTFTYDPTGLATFQALDDAENTTDTFRYTLSDGTTTSTAIVTIAVTGVNDAPIGIDDSGAGFATDEDTLFKTANVLTNDTDIDVEALMLVDVDALSAKGASVTIFDANAGILAYDASGSATLQAMDDAENTTDTFSYTLSDGATTSTATVTMSISGLNDAPIGVDDSGPGYSTSSSSTVTTPNALINDTDIDVETLRLDGVDALSAKGASVVILDANAGTFTYDPTGSAILNLLLLGENTTDTFSYTVTDGTTTGTATVTISVSGLFELPIANDDPNILTVTEDDPLTDVVAPGVLDNDQLEGSTIDQVNTDPAKVNVFFILPSGAELKQLPSGRVRYNPNGAFEWLDDSESTTDTYTYRINNGYTDSATVTITITGVNDAPVGVDDSGAGFSTDEDALFTTASVLTNDTDVDVEPLTVTGVDAISAKGAIVTILDANAGTFTYNPNDSATLQVMTSADNTTDTFTYTVSDGTTTDTATVTLAVAGLDDSLASADNTITAVEDTPYAFTGAEFAFVSSDPSDTLVHVTIGALPVLGLKLLGTPVTPGQDVLAADVTNLTYESDPNDDGLAYATFDFLVFDGIFESPIYTITIDVMADPDVPDAASLATVTVDEDMSFNPGISSSLNDPTNETLTVTLSGLPTGASISDGTNTSTTASTDITTWNQGAIEVTLNAHDDSDFTLTITAVATETNGGASANFVSNTITTVTAVADTPSLSVTNAASGNEDTPIALTISGGLVDTDGSEVLTYQITNVPAGATLNNGVDAGAGVWNLAAADVAGLTITGKTHDDSDFTLNVTAISTDNDASTASPATENIDVTVIAVADQVTLTVTGVINLPEDSNPIPLTIAADLIDTDGSETLVYSISGVIASATLSTGTDAGGGIWTLTEAEAETGLTLTMVDHDGTDFQLLVSAVAIEANDGSSVFSNPADGIIDITINDIADTPTLVVTSPATGDEDTAIALTVSSSLVDTDGSETLSVYIEGHPASATFSAGSDAGGGRWDIDVLDLAGLTISAAANNNDDFILTFTSTTVEADGGDTTSSVETINVTIQAVNDAPTVNDNSFAIDENTPNSTVVGTVIASDIEPIGSEPGQTLSYAITGTAFSIDSSGVVRVNDAAQLDYETTTSFVLLVTVTDNGAPNEQDTATVTIDLNPLDDEVPIANDDAVYVDELGTVFFNVLDNDTDGDLPPEPLSVIRTFGSDNNVGKLLELRDGGILVGTVTLNADGSGVFTANPDSTIEKFQRQLGYTIVSANGTVRSEPAFVYFTVNPINDNQPALTDAGIVLDDIQDLVAGETSGIQYAENASPTVIALPLLFIDLDIDADGILDGDTSDDNDSLVFSVLSNSNPGVVSTSLVSGNLTLSSPPDAHGQATLQIQAIDTAAPAANISAVVLTMTVTVASENDSPVYVIDGGGQPFYQNSNFVFDEDTGPVVIDLANAFVDADLLDATPGDDLLTYTVTIIDQPNASVLSQVLDLTAIGACPAVPTCISSDSGSGGVRTVVIETTATSLTLPLLGDAHGIADITVRATDLGLPNGSPLFDEGTFRVTVNELDDDQPVAQDDHYNDFPALVINEDVDEIVFDVLQNDYQGDVPARVISVGQQLPDSNGDLNAWRTTTRLADPADTGDYTIHFNGQVSCADIACTTGETLGGQVSGAGIGGGNIVYRPGENFTGEDSFTYCIEDSSPLGEAPFTPPADPRCATVTINVVAVNDAPVANNLVIYTMDQAQVLIVTEEEGLKNFVEDVDNTHMDGIGCDSSLPSCTPGAGDPQPDALFFYYDGVTTANAVFVSPFTADGAFNYVPDGSFSGTDDFPYEVCDEPTPGDPDHCDQGMVSIQVSPIAGAPSGSSDAAVEFDYQLAVAPLELPIGPEPNVLIVNDDSGSMGWDIMADGDNQRFRLPSGRLLRWVNKASATSTSYLAASEQAAPGAGLWKLRNGNFNTVYYNPLVQYRPWAGLIDKVEFPDSPPTAARHSPTSATDTTDLTTEITYRGRGAFRNNGRWRTRTVDSDNYYIPRYYKWTDKNGNNLVDSLPSPVTDPTNSEGELIEIRSGSTYPRGIDRTDCGTSPTSCTYAEELQNFANWFTYYRSREFTAKAAIGVVIAGSENLRVGYAKINDPKNSIPVKTMNTSERTGAKAALLDAVYATNSEGGTPLRRALADAGRYFECVADDIFNSTSASLPGSAACPVQAAPAGNCQNNFTLLITDGTWNGGGPGVGNADGDNSSNFDGGAFTSGSGKATLADVAMHYYERDLHPGLDNEVPTSSRDRALASITAFENSDNEIMHQHMTTYTVGFGVKGGVSADPIDYTQSFDWGDPVNSNKDKTDDVRHTAYNGRGAYLDASDGANLSTRLIAAFAEFSLGNGSASAVSFNSQEILEDTLIYRAFYNTKQNTGDLIAQSFTEAGLVETPVWSAAAMLDSVMPTNRQILTLDPGTDPARTHGGIPFRAASLSPSQRNVYISDPTATPAEKTLEVNQKVDYLRGDSSLERPAGNFRERPAVKGRLGDLVHSAPIFIGPPQLQDRDASPYPQSELYSSFAAANASRQALVYVSSNDGMLHAFDATNGVEKFGYVPSNLMLGIFSEKITDLINFEYSHRYFVDLTPAINDVFIDSDDDGDKEWTTMLMGGQGGGGKAYFGLNITDSTKLAEATAGDVVMWEFTDEDDAYPTDASGAPLLTAGSQRMDLQNIPRPVKDMGHSFSVPTLTMSNLVDANGDHEWVAIFGNGYNSTSGMAKLFILFLDRGVDGTWCHPDKKHNIVLNVTPLPAGCATDEYDFVKIDTTFGVKDGFPNGLGTPRGVDIDGNGTLDYAYAGDTFGNFFRFDLTSDDFDDWSYTKIFKAEYVDSSSNVIDQPITTQPILVAHPTESDGFIVIFGTGSYMTVPDGPSLAIQSMYGLWDRLSPELLTKSDLVQQRYRNVNDPTFGNVRVLSSNPVDYSATGGKKGWFNDLNSVAAGGTQGLDSPEFPGERAIRNIQLRGGRAFVNSVIPRSDTSCVDVAGGFALAFCPGTGSSNCLGEGVFDLNNDGEFDTLDEVDNTIVAGIRFEEAVPTDSSFIGDTRVTQLSNQDLESVTTNTNFGANIGRLSWKQLETID